MMLIAKTLSTKEKLAKKPRVHAKVVAVRKMLHQSLQSIKVRFCKIVIAFESIQQWEL